MTQLSPKTKERLTSAVLAALLFAVCFTLFSAARTNVWFMDEMDNYCVGTQLAKGSLLYKDVFSQHMPLMYYICALMSLAGVKSVLAFRLAWYALLSLGYALIFWRYRRDFGRAAMFAWPCIYVASLTTQDLCTSILAEQLQAVGMVLLMLEFLRFVRTRDVPWHMAVTIALAINISFLSAFVAAFGCAVIVLGYVGVEVWDCARQRRGIAGSIASLWKKYRLTIALTLAPMACAALFYVLNGTWDYFFYNIYTFNREIYSGYMDGLGSSPSAAVAGCFTQYWAFAKSVFQTLFQGAANVPLSVVPLQAGWYFFLLWLCARRRFVTAAWLELFFLLCGSRGFFNYHNLQGFALCALACGLCIGGLWKTLRRAPGAKRAAAGAALAAMCASLAVTTGGYYAARLDSLYPSGREFEAYYEPHSNEALLLALTEPGEFVLENINHEELYLIADIRLPAYNTGMSPWWWEATRERSMELLQADPPRYAVYDPEYTAFGQYVVEDFAPELDAFIQENYTQIFSDTPQFWVRNDCLDEARAKIGVQEDMVGCVTPNLTCGNLTEGVEVSQVFTASRETVETVGIQFGTHNLRYRGTVRVRLTDEATGKLLFEKEIDGSALRDNEFFTVYDSAADGALALEEGRSYAVRLTASDPTGCGNLTVWACPGEATDTNYAVVNGQKQDYTLRIKVR